MPKIIVKNFWSPDYETCNIQIPLVKDLESIFRNRVRFEHVKAEEDEEQVSKYNVKDYPTIIILCNDKERERFIGLTQQLFLKKAIERALSECE